MDDTSTAQSPLQHLSGKVISPSQLIKSYIPHTHTHRDERAGVCCNTIPLMKALVFPSNTRAMVGSMRIFSRSQRNGALWTLSFTNLYTSTMGVAQVSGCGLEPGLQVLWGQLLEVLVHYLTPPRALLVEVTHNFTALLTNIKELLFFCYLTVHSVSI